MTIRAWVDQTKVSLAKVNSETIRAVQQTFDHAGMDMPAPTHQLEINREGQTAVSRDDDDARQLAAGTTDVGIGTGDISPADEIQQQVEAERDHADDLLSDTATSEI